MTHDFDVSDAVARALEQVKRRAAQVREQPATLVVRSLREGEGFHLSIVGDDVCGPLGDGACSLAMTCGNLAEVVLSGRLGPEATGLALRRLVADDMAVPTQAFLDRAEEVAEAAHQRELEGWEAYEAGKTQFPPRAEVVSVFNLEFVDGRARLTPPQRELLEDARDQSVQVELSPAIVGADLAVGEVVAVGVVDEEDHTWRDSRVAACREAMLAEVPVAQAHTGQIIRPHFGVGDLLIKLAAGMLLGVALSWAVLPRSRELDVAADAPPPGPQLTEPASWRSTEPREDPPPADAVMTDHAPLELLERLEMELEPRLVGPLTETDQAVLEQLYLLGYIRYHRSLAGRLASLDERLTMDDDNYPRSELQQAIRCLINEEVEAGRGDQEEGCDPSRRDQEVVVETPANHDPFARPGSNEEHAVVVAPPESAPEVRAEDVVAAPGEARPLEQSQPTPESSEGTASPSGELLAGVVPKQPQPTREMPLVLDAPLGGGSLTLEGVKLALPAAAPTKDGHVALSGCELTATALHYVGRDGDEVKAWAGTRFEVELAPSASLDLVALALSNGALRRVRANVGFLEVQPRRGRAFALMDVSLDLSLDDAGIRMRAEGTIPLPNGDVRLSISRADLETDAAGRVRLARVVAHVDLSLTEVLPDLRDELLARARQVNPEVFGELTLPPFVYRQGRIVPDTIDLTAAEGAPNVLGVRAHGGIEARRSRRRWTIAGPEGAHGSKRLVTYTVDGALHVKVEGGRLDQLRASARGTATRFSGELHVTPLDGFRASVDLEGAQVWQGTLPIVSESVAAEWPELIREMHISRASVSRENERFRIEVEATAPR